jgi:CPA2 family monovalent cation:H+ antiporter-2
VPHNVTLITTIAAAFGLALVFGVLAVRLKLPALVGYLIAGVLIGPATPGFVADVDLSQQLAEIGVILLMFGVGLHFSMEDLIAVRRIALPGAVAQIAVATMLGAGVASFWGWSLGAGIVFGLALSVASTVVLLRALEDRGVLDSINGRIAIGWLVVEDLVMVVILVLLPALAGSLGGSAGTGAAAAADYGSVLRSLAFTLGKVAAFVALMFVVGRRLLPWLLWQVARTGSRELFTLCVTCGRQRACNWWRSSVCRSRSRPFAPGRLRGRVQPPPPRSRCRCAMPFRCCSSSRWGCCSSPRSWSINRSACSAWWPSSSSARRSRRSPWCSRSATRSTRR